MSNVLTLQSTIIILGYIQGLSWDTCGLKVAGWKHLALRETCIVFPQGDSCALKWPLPSSSLEPYKDKVVIGFLISLAWGTRSPFLDTQLPANPNVVAP